MGVIMANSTNLQVSLPATSWLNVAAATEQALVTVYPVGAAKAASVQLIYSDTEPAVGAVGHTFIVSTQSPNFILGSVNTEAAWLRSTTGTLKISYTVL